MSHVSLLRRSVDPSIRPSICLTRGRLVVFHPVRNLYSDYSLDPLWFPRDASTWQAQAPLNRGWLCRFRVGTGRRPYQYKGWLQRQLLRLSLRRAADGVSALHDGGHHAYGENAVILIITRPKHGT